jgi:hypothetical protein
MRESFPDQLGGGCEKIGCWLAEIYNRAVVSRLTAEILVQPVVKVVGACHFLHNIRSEALNHSDVDDGCFHIGVFDHPAGPKAAGSVVIVARLYIWIMGVTVLRF